jgi:hypothetical protein
MSPEYFGAIFTAVCRADVVGAADEDRHREPLSLELLGDMDHLLEARRDQPGETDDIDLLGPGRLEDLRRRDHHAEVDHLVTVAAEHHADDVLADVVDVALARWP